MIAVTLFAFLMINACLSAPATNIPIKGKLLMNEKVYDKNGQFTLSYAVDDGTTQSKIGYLVPNDNGDGFVMNEEGSYSFITPDGVNVKMYYTADKNGFRVLDQPSI